MAGPHAGPAIVRRQGRGDGNWARSTRSNVRSGSTRRSDSMIVADGATR